MIKFHRRDQILFDFIKIRDKALFITTVSVLSLSNLLIE